MPNYLEIPMQGNASFSNYDVEDTAKFATMPYWLAYREARKMQGYKVFDKLFGKTKWVANDGPIMRSIRPEYSPVTRSLVFPSNITSLPTRNIFETQESAEEARIKLHVHETRPLHFLPPFQAFRDNILAFNHDNLMRQMAVFNDLFILGQLFMRAPQVYIPGNNGSNSTIADTVLSNAPTAELTSETADTTGGKGLAWRQAVCQNCGSQGFTLGALWNGLQIVSDDLDAPPFEGTVNTDRPNELVKGKYVVVGSSELWLNWAQEASSSDLKSINLDLVFDGFKGSLFGTTTFKVTKNPYRFDKDGRFVAPEVEVPATFTSAAGGTVTGFKTRPNPKYTSLDWETGAPIECAVILGDGVANTITVGAPPKEFSKRNMAADKFYSLNWNGEIRITDQFLVSTGSNEYFLNDDAFLLKLKAKTTHGYLPLEPNNMLLVFYRRRRASVASNI